MSWPRVLLGEIITLEYGKALPARDRDEGGKYPVAGSNGVQGVHSRFLVDGPGIVVGRKGSAGKVVWYEQPHWPIDTTYFVKPKIKIDLRYVFYLLSHLQLERLKTVTGVPGLNRDDVYREEVCLPTYSEQQRIVEILDEADALQRKRSEANERAQCILSALFLRMFREEIEKQPPILLGDVTQEFRYGTSNRSSDDGFPTLRIPNIVRGKFNLNEIKMVPVTDLEFDRLRLVNGDMLVVRTNGNPDYVGRSMVFDKSEVEGTGLPTDEFIYASYLIRIRFEMDKAEPWFVNTYLSLPEGRRALRERCRTSAGQFNINIEALSSIPLPRIPIEQQREFCSAMLPVRELSVQQAGSSERIDSVIKLVMHKAFSGELTAKWREAHADELLREAKEQAALIKQADVRGPVRTGGSRPTMATSC